MRLRDIRDILAAPMTLPYVLSEVKELLTAKTWSEAYEEWNDVVLCTLLWLANKDECVYEVRLLPGLGRSTALKYIARLDVWRSIFALHGAVFATRYLAEGSNYKKLEKVRKALAHCGVYNVRVDEVAGIVGGFEDGST